MYNAWNFGSDPRNGWSDDETFEKHSSFKKRSWMDSSSAGGGGKLENAFIYFS